MLRAWDESTFCSEMTQAERAAKRWQLRLKEADEKMSELEARAGLAKQRIAILEKELETSQDAQKDLQTKLLAAKAASAREKEELQVCPLRKTSCLCRYHKECMCWLLYLQGYDSIQTASTLPSADLIVTAGTEKDFEAVRGASKFPATSEAGRCGGARDSGGLQDSSVRGVRSCGWNNVRERWI
jgi:hypothetical protein